MGITIAGILVFITYKLYQAVQSGVAAAGGELTEAEQYLQSVPGKVASTIEAPFTAIGSAVSGAYDYVTGSGDDGADSTQ